MNMDSKTYDRLACSACPASLACVANFSRVWFACTNCSQHFVHVTGMLATGYGRAPGGEFLVPRACPMHHLRRIRQEVGLRCDACRDACSDIRRE